MNFSYNSIIPAGYKAKGKQFPYEAFPFGLYFYVTARTPYEAELQGRYFVSIISDTGYDCRPAMDFEEYSGL